MQPPVKRITGDISQGKGGREESEAGLQPVPTLQYGSDGLWIEKNKHLTAFFCSNSFDFVEKKALQNPILPKARDPERHFPFQLLKTLSFSDQKFCAVFSLVA